MRTVYSMDPRRPIAGQLLAIGLTLVVAGCGATRSVPPSAHPAVSEGLAAPGSGVPSSSPAFPAALPDPSPAGLPVNGWVAYIQSSAIRFASPDGQATLDAPAIGDVNCPAFAPVGALLAYRRDDNLVIAAIGERGTIEAQLTAQTPLAADACPIWSPDGRAIAESVFGETAAADLIRIVTLDGSIRRVLLPGRGWSQWIAWSFDGSSILAARGGQRLAEVLLIPLDGQEPMVVYETSTTAAWREWDALTSSPAAPYFAVVIPRCDESLPLPGGEEVPCLRVVGFNGDIVFDESLSGTGMAAVEWAPDGRRLAWFGQGGIRVRSVNEGESQLIPLERRVEGAGGQVVVDTSQGLAWSPDGTRLLCEVSYTTGERHEHAIVSVAADGSGDVIVHSGWQTETALIRSVDLAWQRR